MPDFTAVSARGVESTLYRFLGLSTFGAGLFVGLIPAVQAISQGASPVGAAVWGVAGLSFVAMGIYWVGAHARIDS